MCPHQNIGWRSSLWLISSRNFINISITLSFQWLNRYYCAYCWHVKHRNCLSIDLHIQYCLKHWLQQIDVTRNQVFSLCLNNCPKFEFLTKLHFFALEILTFHIMQMQCLLVFLWIFFIISGDECLCQKIASNSNRINRMRGSIITNLTRTHAYDDDIVTSHLDASVRIRQFYRMFRDIYNKYDGPW